MIARIRNAAGRAAGFSGCLRCGDTWNYKPSHTTPYKEGRGCFPLCEECWGELTPEARLPYYEELWDEWVRQFALVRDEDTRRAVLQAYGPSEHDAIMAAVRAGL